MLYSGYMEEMVGDLILEKYQCACSTEEIFLQYFQVILKQVLENILKT